MTEIPLSIIQFWLAVGIFLMIVVQFFIQIHILKLNKRIRGKQKELNVLQFQMIEVLASRLSILEKIVVEMSQ